VAKGFVFIVHFVGRMDEKEVHCGVKERCVGETCSEISRLLMLPHRNPVLKATAATAYGSVTHGAPTFAGSGDRLFHRILRFRNLKCAIFLSTSHQQKSVSIYL